MVWLGGVFYCTNSEMASSERYMKGNYANDAVNFEWTGRIMEELVCTMFGVCLI